jgi:hypothetical protein
VQSSNMSPVQASDLERLRRARRAGPRRRPSRSAVQLRLEDPDARYLDHEFLGSETPLVQPDPLILEHAPSLATSAACAGILSASRVDRESVASLRQRA